VSLETFETQLTQSDRLKEAEWSFTALRNHSRASDFEDIVEDAYVLELPDEGEVAIPESLGETAQAKLGDGNGLVVTFSPEVAEKYPSVRLLLPGDPLFEALIQEVTPEEAIIWSSSVDSVETAGPQLLEALVLPIQNRLQ